MPIDSLNVRLSDEHTVGSVLNSILELSQDSRQSLSKYLELIKICESMPEKEETICRQNVLLQRQKHTIERLKKANTLQAQEIIQLKTLLGENCVVSP